MGRTIRLLAVWLVALVVFLGATGAGAQGQVDVVANVRIEADGSPGSHQVAAAVQAAARTVHARGWRTPGMVIRVLENPFDATVPGSDLALGSLEPVEEAFFRTVEALVRRDLGRVAPPSRASVAARLVAAHLSPPSTKWRRAWQESWLTALAGGEVMETALLETAWRVGGDDLLRAVTAVPWPEGALAVLADRLEGDVLEAVSEVVLAGLFNPSALGFEAPAPLLPGLQGRRFADGIGGELGFGVHLLPLPVRASAEAVTVLRSQGMAVHAGVRYPFPGQYDVVRLREGEEVAVPLRGVSWAGVVVTNLSLRGALSLTARPLAEYPVALERWDFAASPENVVISWETRRHDGVLGFVVEAMARAGGSWQSLQRDFLPVADSGEDPFSYCYLQAGDDQVHLYRLLALTRDGFLAEIGTFPVVAP